MLPICTTCGTQFGQAPTPPESCPICEDERQWVRWAGQDWTDLAALSRRHAVRCGDDLGLLGLDIEPDFGIGQRALLVPTPAGNLLWDCLSLVDEGAVAAIRARGGLAAIAISHPHYYSAMAEWSEAFGGVPIHLHADDAEWVMRPHPAVRHWSGDTLRPLPGLTLIRCGGHFAGATVLHREADGGELLVGDTVQVCPDRRWVSFMYSFPNYIPLGPEAVRRIAGILNAYRFERIRGAFRGQNVSREGNAALARSAERYLKAIG